MADTVEGEIFEALMARVTSLTLSPVMPVAWPNKAFTPPADHKFLRVTHVPNINVRRQITSDGAHQRLGILELSVFWPRNTGEDGLVDVAGKVAAHFPCDLRMVSGTTVVRVSKAPDVRDAMIDEPRVHVPVMIEWECYA